MDNKVIKLNNRIQRGTKVKLINFKNELNDDFFKINWIPFNRLEFTVDGISKKFTSKDIITHTNKGRI